MKIIKFNSTEIRIEDPKDGEEQTLRAGRSVRGVRMIGNTFQFPTDRGVLIFWLEGNLFCRSTAWDRTDPFECTENYERQLYKLGFRTGMNMLKCHVSDAEDMLGVNLDYVHDGVVYIQLVPDPHCTVID